MRMAGFLCRAKRGRGRGWGRAAIAMAAVRSLRCGYSWVLSKFDDVLSPSANGRDGNHVPTSRQGAELKGGSIGNPDDWLGTKDDGSGFIHSVLDAVICHLPSIQPSMFNNLMTRSPSISGPNA